MANSVNTNPVRIDTVFAAGTSYKSLTSATLGTLFTIRVAKIRWVLPTAQKDVCLITEPGSGQELWRGVCNAALTDVVEDFVAAPKLWRDFVIDQFDSGRLYIHLV